MYITGIQEFEGDTLAGFESFVLSSTSQVSSANQVMKSNQWFLTGL
jgi:hypothetical protein